MCSVYQEGDCCDARDPNSGAWFEAVVTAVRVQKAPAPGGGSPRRQYAVQFEG